MTNDGRVLDLRAFPKALSIYRAERDPKAPVPVRDMLIEVIRQIDAGEIAPDAAVCVVRDQRTDGPYTGVFNATPDIFVGLAILHLGMEQLGSK